MFKKLKEWKKESPQHTEVDANTRIRTQGIRAPSGIPRYEQINYYQIRNIAVC